MVRAIAAAAAALLLVDAVVVAARLGDDRSVTVSPLSGATLATPDSSEAAGDQPSPSTTEPSTDTADHVRSAPSATDNEAEPAAGETPHRPSTEEPVAAPHEPDSEPPAAPPTQPATSPARTAPTITVVMKPATSSSTAGDPVTYVVEVELEPGEPGSLNVDFGNGVVHEDVRCTERKTIRWCQLGHSYRVGGEYTIRATWCEACPHNQPWGESQATVQVADGPYMSNGKSEPTGWWRGYTGDEERGIDLQLSVGDGDGCVRTVEVDWGDGTTDPVRTNPDTCTAPNSEAFATSGWTVPRFGHTYAEDGEYWITITITSTGPDGADEQIGTIAKRIDVPYDPGLPTTG